MAAKAAIGTGATSNGGIGRCLGDTHKNKEGKGKLGAYAMERVAAGAHLPDSWLFEPAKRPDDRADYCLGCSFLP